VLKVALYEEASNVTNANFIEDLIPRDESSSRANKR
jgi:hypothetical protein